MPRFKRKSNARDRRPRQQYVETAAPVDFSPLIPFLVKRLGEDHPICVAARTSDLSGFMAAIRASGDTKLEHEIAGELVRIDTPLPRA